MTDTRAALIAAIQEFWGCKKQPRVTGSAGRTVCRALFHDLQPWTMDGCPVAVAAADHPALAAVLAQVRADEWDTATATAQALVTCEGGAKRYRIDANPHRSTDTTQGDA